MFRFNSLRNAAVLYLVFASTVTIIVIIQHSSSSYIHFTRIYSSLCTNTYPVSYTKRLYHPLDIYEQVQLIFYKKMKMAIAVEVCHKNGWILRKTAHSRQELYSLLKENVFSIIFTSSKELSSPFMVALLNKSNVLVTGIPNAYLFTGAKREQYVTFQRFLNKYECSINSLKFMPTSFLMDNVRQCKEFHKHLRLNKDSQVWVLKKSQGFGGDGVKVISNMTTIKHMFDTCPSTHQYIMQEYLQNILLLNGRKFDVRALVLIANTRPYMLFYHKGYLRVIMNQFNLKGSRDVHLTNTHVQSVQPNFDPDDHFWSFSKFQSYLDIHHPDNEGYVSTNLVPHIKRVATFILKSGHHLMNGEGTHTGFQLLGLDLMITNNWHIWFIEANNYPLWPKGGWVTQFTTLMGDDLFDLVINMRQKPKDFLSMPINKWYNSWQLIWRENSPNCPEEEEYNPCISLQQVN